MKTDYEMIFDIFLTLYKQGQDVDVKRLTKHAVLMFLEFHVEVQREYPDAAIDRSEVMNGLISGAEKS